MERAFLLQAKELSKTQQRYIRYKLRKKTKQFYNVELPLLIKKGYITTSTGNTSGDNDNTISASAKPCRCEGFVNLRSSGEYLRSWVRIPSRAYYSVAASSHDEEDAAVIGSHDMAYSGREELTSPFLAGSSHKVRLDGPSER